MQIIQDLPPIFPRNTYVAIDVELFGMNKKILHRPTTGRFACLTICADPDIVYIFDKTSDIQPILNQLWDCIWVAQEAKFDLTQLRRWATINPRRKLWDTLLIERIMFGGLYDMFALQHLARRHLNIYVDKSLQKAWEKANELTPELIQYACTDASITLQICQEQRKIISKAEMWCWMEIEQPALWAILDFQGFALDVEAWTALAEKNRQRTEEINKQFTFNPRSPAQVKKILWENGFINLKDTQEKTLSKMIARKSHTEAAKIARQVLDSRMYAKRASTYGLGWIENYLEDEEGIKVIHADFGVIGAETSRMNCTSPNLQNVPLRDTNEFRECFISRPNHVLIVADYSAQEPRITAHLSQDKRLLEIFHSGDDVYCETYRLMYGKKLGRDNPIRNRMKTVFLGMSYGLSEYGLSMQEGIDKDEAAEMIAGIFRVFTGFAEWAERQRHNKNFVRTVTGRKVWLNPYNSQCENNTLNAPIQGTAAEITKRALGLMHKNWKFDFPFGVVAVIHDEIVLDVPERVGDGVSRFVKKHMIEAAQELCPTVLFKVDIHIGHTWACKG
jgi:DNA polymerase I-like protein with 3'-5' exonuclease and polymerase domains